VKQPLFTANYAQNRNGSGWESTLQPITTEPEIIAPCNSRQKGYLVIFGTGRYLKDDEYNDVSGQTFYGIWDWTDEWVELQKTNPAIKPEQKFLGLLNLPSEENASINPPYVRTLSEQSTQPVTRKPPRSGSQGLSLLEQVQISGAATAGESTYRFISNNKMNWYSPANGTGEHVGWFFNLPGTGERMVTD
jgi:type IV pilus assembly protein PilY1